MARLINVSDGLSDGKLYSEEIFSMGNFVACPFNQFPIVSDFEKSFQKHWSKFLLFRSRRCGIVIRREGVGGVARLIRR